MAQHRFAVDLITLYHPGFWGLDDPSELETLEPRRAWDRMLGAVREAGATGVETTFPPGDLGTGRSAYGGVDGLKAALDDHGLEVIGGYFGALDGLTAPLDPGEQRRVVDEASRYAAEMAEIGGEIVISGMPSLDATVDRGASTFVDLEYVKQLADVVNRVAGAVAEQGARYALHPEFGSVFCRRREIDLFMLLTDPAVVGFCPDTAHITVAGGDPVAIVEAHRERVILTHWKDATGPFHGTLPEGDARHGVLAAFFAEVGQGVVDWDAWQRMLDRIGYDGWTVLELDGSPDPEQQVRGAREFVERALV